MRAFAILAATATLLVTPLAPVRPAGAQGSAPRAEHHLHISTASAARLLATLQPGPLADTSAVRAVDALRAMDSAGVREALVLSTGYLFSARGFHGTQGQRARMTRAENAYVARESALAPGRLYAACSVDPRAPFAREEVRRCAADARISAFKLHLGASDLDLLDPRHLATLRRVVAQIGRAGLPVVMHVRGGERYGAEHAEALIREVIVPNDAVIVQVAHAAGWGGYDEATDAALGAFERALSQGRVRRDRISFDLGAVVFSPRAAGADSALAARVVAMNARLASRIRAIGVDRFVFATDWPGWPPTRDRDLRIRQQVALLRAELPLSEAEFSTLLASESVVLTAARARRAAVGTEGGGALPRSGR